MRSLYRFAILVSVIYLAVGSCQAANKSIMTFHDDWMDVYLKAVKIGYRHITVTGSASSGTQMYYKDDSVVLKDDRLSNVCFTTHSVYDGYCRPVQIHFELQKLFPNRRTKRLGSMDLSFKNGKCKFTKDIGKPVQMYFGCPSPQEQTEYGMNELGFRRFTIGERTHFCTSLEGYALGKLKCRLAWPSATATKTEPLAAGGEIHTATIVQGEGCTSWWSDGGVLLKETYTGDPLYCLYNKKEKAIGDFQKTKVWSIPLDREIPNFYLVNEVRIRLFGLDPKGAVLDDRQNVVYDRAEKAMEFHITANAFNPSKSLSRPISRTDYRQWLQPSQGVESSNSRIRSIANEVAGNETSTYLTACRLRAWVYKNIKRKLASGVGVSALDTLKAKTGDCKHHALLFAAMARSLGIPTRLAVGVTYGDDHKLSYHAWAECYVGEWVPFDPTLPWDFVDSCHMKLCSVTSLTGPESARIADSLGGWRAEVKDYQYLDNSEAVGKAVMNDAFALVIGKATFYFSGKDLTKVYPVDYSAGKSITLTDMLAELPNMQNPPDRCTLCCPHGVRFQFPAYHAPHGDVCKLHGSFLLGTLVVFGKDGSMRLYPHGMESEE